MYGKFLAIFTLILIWSCEQQTTIIFNLENQSKEMIFVKGLDKFVSRYDSIIPTGQSGVLFSNTSFGLYSKRPLPAEFIDEGFSVTNKSGDTLTLDYKLLENWEYTKEEHKWWVAHEQVMTVTEDDF